VIICELEYFCLIYAFPLDMIFSGGIIDDMASDSLAMTVVRYLTGPRIQSKKYLTLYLTLCGLAEEPIICGAEGLAD